MATPDAPRLPSSYRQRPTNSTNPGMRRILGDDFVNHFVATRRWEAKQFQSVVTDWELQRYFEII